MIIRFAALAPLLVAGCTPVGALLQPASFAAAAEPSSQSTPAPAAAVVAYTPRQITDPADWRSLNDAQSPAGATQ